MQSASKGNNVTGACESPLKAFYQHCHEIRCKYVCTSNIPVSTDPPFRPLKNNLAHCIYPVYFQKVYLFNNKCILVNFLAWSM